MFVQERYNWKLTFIYGDSHTHEVRLTVKDVYSGMCKDFSITVGDAEEFNKELTVRIQQAKTGEYS